MSTLRFSDPSAKVGEDFLNKVACDLVERHDGIALEDLRIPKMVQNRCLSKSILDAGWGYLVSQLTHKAEEAGRVVELVDPAYTSKTCSGCGFVFTHLTLKERWIECGCGLSLDRDHNEICEGIADLECTAGATLPRSTS